MQISWDFPLVILSVLTAMFGSFAAFIHLRQMRENTSHAAYMWMFAGGTTLGISIWSSIFIGILAFHLPIPLSFSPGMALVSALPVVLLSLIGFFVLRDPMVSTRNILVSGALFGMGISLTQHACMSSIQITPPLHYEPIRLSLSAAIGIAASSVALLMGRLNVNSWLRSTMGAVAMGAGVVIVHFYIVSSLQIPVNSSSPADTISSQRFISILLFLVILFWLAGGIIAMLFDRRMVRQNADALVKLQVAYDALDNRAQKLANDRSRNVLDKALDAVINTDAGGLVTEWNGEAERIFNYTYDEAIGRNIADLVIPPAHRSAHHSGMTHFLKTGESHILGKRIEITALRKGGEEFPVELSVTPVRQHGEVFFSAFIRDITDRKETEQRIHQLAFYDSLTQLPNRRLLQDRLRQAFATTARNNQYGAILLMDLDHFKTLNDSKGHEIGDLLLLDVAKRLETIVREGDTVARLGGDEFLVLIKLSPNSSDAVAQAELIAEKIRASLSQPYIIKECTYHTTPSIGIALFKGNQESVDDLLKHADTAMYQAKKHGRNAIRFYDPEMQAQLEARATLEEELRTALSKKQFRLYYQVQVDSLRRPLGAEVLLRWERADRGEVCAPLQYISLAEDTNLIVPIGLWVLKTACAQLAAWQEDPLTRDLVLAVNVSAKQFRQADFVAQIQNILLESCAKPSHLKLELTESTVLENVQDTIAKMRELKLLGVDFSMDDFGTGYSSLQYLKRLPLNQIKIDQSFVRDITSDPNDAAIVQTIIAMSQALGLNVIAEGVETQAQMDFLNKHGCHTFQGYLFSKPLPIDQFTTLLHEAPAATN